MITGVLYNLCSSFFFLFGQCWIKMTTSAFINFLHSTVKAKDAIIYSYTRHINGFAAMLDEKEAAEIASEEYNLIQFSGFLYWWLCFPLFLYLLQAKFMQLGPYLTMAVFSLAEDPKVISVLYSLLLQDWFLFPFTKSEEIWKCCMHVSSPTNFFVQALKVGYVMKTICFVLLLWHEHIWLQTLFFIGSIIWSMLIYFKPTYDVS